MRRTESATLFLAALAIGTLLLLTGSVGFTLALRANLLPPFDVQFTVDGRNALVIDNDRPCTPDAHTQHTCKDGGLMYREFHIIVRTPIDDRVLVSINLPAR
jgi:hypothetical protein